MFNPNASEHIGDLIKQSAPETVAELQVTASVGQCMIWCIRSILILAKEVNQLKMQSNRIRYDFYGERGGEGKDQWDRT